MFNTKGSSLLNILLFNHNREKKNRQCISEFKRLCKQTLRQEVNPNNFQILYESSWHKILS